VITYEIEVCNNGQAGSTLPVVTISDPLYTGGSYTTGSTLAFGACDTEVYTYTASAAGTLPNTAQVTTSGYETSDSANTSVEPFRLLKMMLMHALIKLLQMEASRIQILGLLTLIHYRQVQQQFRVLLT